MRPIGSIHDPLQARRFGDYLLANGVRNQVDREADGTYTVWISDDEQVSAAQACLERFRANPSATEFRNAEAGATQVRQADAEDLEAYRRRVRTRKSLFPRFGGYGIGWLTPGLFIACVAVAFYSHLGRDQHFVHYLQVSDPGNFSPGFLAEVRQGEVWRLITPIFLHFGAAHIIFNMLWLIQLGGMIEGRLGATALASVVAVTGITSNVAQYWMHGANFGGMSGVVYGLAGFVWLRGKYHPGSGVFLDQQSIQWMLIWLVVCYTGMAGPIANTAHVVGLIAGLICGRVSAARAWRRPE